MLKNFGCYVLYIVINQIFFILLSFIVDKLIISFLLKAAKGNEEMYVYIYDTNFCHWLYSLSNCVGPTKQCSGLGSQLLQRSRVRHGCQTVRPRSHQWLSSKTDRRKVPGSFLGRTCRPSCLEFSMFFSQTCINTG